MDFTIFWTEDKSTLIAAIREALSKKKHNSDQLRLYCFCFAYSRAFECLFETSHLRCSSSLGFCRSLSFTASPPGKLLWPLALLWKGAPQAYCIHGARVLRLRIAVQNRGTRVLAWLSCENHTACQACAVIQRSLRQGMLVEECCSTRKNYIINICTGVQSSTNILGGEECNKALI